MSTVKPSSKAARMECNRGSLRVGLKATQHAGHQAVATEEVRQDQIGGRSAAQLKDESL